MGQDGKLKLIDFGESKVYEGKTENYLSYSVRPRRTKSKKSKKSKTKKSKSVRNFSFYHR